MRNANQLAKPKIDRNMKNDASLEDYSLVQLEGSGRA